LKDLSEVCHITITFPCCFYWFEDYKDFIFFCFYKHYITQVKMKL